MSIFLFVLGCVMGDPEPGARPLEDLERALSGQEARLHACLPFDVRASLTFDVQVSPDGHVLQAVPVDGASPEISRCVGEVLRTANMPERTDGPTHLRWVLHPPPRLQAPASGFDVGIQRVTVGDPIRLGNIELDALHASVRTALPTIEGCATRGFDGRSAAGGKLVIKFVIAKDGTVSKADVKTSTLRDADVEQCALRAFEQLTFPPPKGGGIAIVSYPLTFAG